MALSGKIVGAGVVAMSLTACAGSGDFGRAKPNEFSFLKDVGGEISTLVAPGGVSTDLPMTAEEIQLRVLADNIKVQTAPERSIFDQLSLSEPVPHDEKSYYLLLRQKYAESGVALLNAFGNDVMRDVTMVDQISGLSISVTGADALRLSLVSDAMAANRAAFSDAVDVILRVENNGEVIDHTVDLMAERLKAYRTALEQAAFDIPERDLIAVIDEAIDMLDISVSNIREDAARHRAVRGELFARRSSDLPV